ncbi:hypothetical protein BSZ35_19160 [Salinibacter sp. 10B]|uniref:hypothetical protein n=1 Tax=Salinibacter sp. 10B TaxID=1923971 RepID=UPI000CF46D81|nr:hypothetical protein [Salinibacter sp. 10B]PQJ26769.1 hypothetical protein BSZ35_19160 [Salinibacter sp. 10B]
MTPQDYIDQAKDPTQWLRKAEDLLEDHDILWEKVEEMLKQLKRESQPETEQRLARRLASLMLSSELLLALSVENALKGHLLSEKPQEVEMTISVDGEGDFREARLSSIASNHPNHDLLALAHELDIFAQQDNPLLDSPPDPEGLETILEHLTHVIRWVGRYPVPLDYEEHTSWRDQIMTDDEGVTSTLHTMFENHNMALDLARQLTPDEVDAG